MTPEQFCYWFQGFVELSKDAPTPEQWKSIQEHLQTVFKKVTPPVLPNPISIPKAPEKTIGWPPQPDWLEKWNKGNSWPEKAPVTYC